MNDRYDAKTGKPGVPCDGFAPYCGMDLADSDTNDGTFQPWMNKWASLLHSYGVVD